MQIFLFRLELTLQVFPAIVFGLNEWLVCLAGSILVVVVNSGGNVRGYSSLKMPVSGHLACGNREIKCSACRAPVVHFSIEDEAEFPRLKLYTVGTARRGVM